VAANGTARRSAVSRDTRLSARGGRGLFAGRIRA